MLRWIIVQNNIFKKLRMKTISKALVAHDQRKADMVDWVKFNAQYIS